MTKPKKTESKKTESKKYLHIGLKKNNITKAVNNYCNAMQVDLKDVGFHMGHIVGSSKNLEEPLGALMQIHFFAGIHHAMLNKKDIIFKSLSKDEWEKVKAENIEKSLKKDDTEKATVSYMG